MRRWPTIARGWQLWGSPGEQQALFPPLPLTTKPPFHLELPQFERLAPAPQFRPRPGESPPGADLARLGLLKKK